MAPYAALYYDTGAEMLAAQARTEELIAQCMADRGFEYIPQEPIDWAARSDGLTQGTPEYIARFGYGVTPIPGSGSLERPARDEGDVQGADVSDSYSQAFWEALHGRCDAAECSWDASMPVDDSSGCWKIATHEVASDSAASDAGFAALMEQWTEISGDVWTGNHLEPANRAWAGCMADAGYPGIDSPLMASSWVEARTRGMWDPPGRAPTEAELVQAHDMDVAVASADAACQAETGWLDQVEQGMAEAADAFVAEHRAELDQYAAQYSRG